MRYRPWSSVTTIRANFVGRSVVSAITQTPASGPFELVTTPPISVARTSTLCWARKSVEHANIRVESRANASKLRSASAKWNIGSPPWHRSRLVAGFLLATSLTKLLRSVLQILVVDFSACETTASQEGLLFGGCGATERGIAMREPAETADDVGVNLRPLQVFCIPGGLVERYAAFLVGEIFRMLEREIEEATQFVRHLAIEAANDGTGRDRARKGIGGKGARVAAEHVTRELVKQDQQGQRALRTVLPIGKLPRRCCFVGTEKPLVDCLVESGVLIEPAVRSGLVPERDDFCGTHDH